MEQNMTESMRKYFDNIEKYIGLKLYFYGSIHRIDFFKNSSDIDIDIFSENPQSTFVKLKHFLHKPNQKYKMITTIINGKVIKGCKFSHVDSKLNIRCEFSIYPKWAKPEILQEHKKKTILPFHGTVCLMIIKTLYYSLNLISFDTYKYLKKIVLSQVIGYRDPPFLIFNQKNF